MKKVRNYLLALLFVTTTGGAVLSVATPQATRAACSESLLTFPAWYKGLLMDAKNDKCDIKAPVGDEGLRNFIWTIVLNVIEILLQLVGYIAAGFIIFGGYKYMISAGSPDGMVKARKTITNAVIGLVISMFSVAIVNLVSGAIQ